jgi:hypothetical protein
VLKLHGSVNWYAPGLDQREDVLATLAKDGLTLEGEPVSEAEGTSFVNRVSAALQRVTVYDSYDCLKREVKDGIPFLVPPTWSKTLSAPLTNVWREAVKALRTATRIIIMGYSIPPTDLHFKYLIAAGLQENISLRKIFFVNSGLADQSSDKQQLEERLFRLFRPEHFDQGIIEPVRADIGNFLTGPREVNGRSYRFEIGRTVNSLKYMYDTTDSMPWRVYTGSHGGLVYV